MGKMYTLKPDESINDHVKESMEIINHIVELSISCMRDLANPHEGTFVDMTFNKFMRSLEHIRESIQMLDDLTDELEDSVDDVRSEYEEKVIQFFNRFMNSDFTDEYQHRIEQLNADLAHFRTLAASRNKELEGEREHSTQLEKRCVQLVRDRDAVVEYWTKHCEDIIQKHRKELVLKDRQIADLTEERDYYQDCLHKLANRASNFCGNCAHYAQIGKDNDEYEYEGICTQHYIKRVDPDDASCSHFKSNQTDRVVIGKPEFPCCDKCNHDDCDNCTLCPF